VDAAVVGQEFLSEFQSPVEGAWGEVVAVLHLDGFFDCFLEEVDVFDELGLGEFELAEDVIAGDGLANS